MLNLRTNDEEGDKANDEEGGAADNDATSKVDERWKQQSGPKQEIQECPWSAMWNYCGSGKLAFLVVNLLQSILRRREEELVCKVTTLKNE